MSHILRRAALAVASLSGGVAACSAWRLLVAPAGTSAAAPARVERAHDAAVAMPTVTAPADGREHAAATAAEQPSVVLDGICGGLRVDGWLPTTIDNLRATLVSATRLARTDPRGSFVTRPEPVSCRTAGALASRLCGGRRATYAAAPSAPRKRLAWSTLWLGLGYAHEITRMPVRADSFALPPQRSPVST